MTSKTSLFPATILDAEPLEGRNLMDAAPSMTMTQALTALERERTEMLLVDVRIDTLQQDIDNWTVELSNDTTAARTAQADLFSVQGQLQGAVTKGAELRDSMQLMMSTISTLTGEEGVLQPQVAPLQEQIAQLGQQLAQWTLERVALADALNALETQWQELQEQLAAQETVVTSKTDDVTLKQTVVTTATITLQKDQGALQTATASLSQAQATLQTANTTLAADQKLLTDAKTTLTAATKTYNDLVKKYGPNPSWRRKLEIANAKAAMDAAAAKVNALTLIVKNDQIVFDAATLAVANWTKTHNAATVAVATDTTTLGNAQSALTLALSALDAATTERTRILGLITTLEPQLESAQAELSQKDGTIAAGEGVQSQSIVNLQTVTDRLTAIGIELTDLTIQLNAVTIEETNLLKTIEQLQTEVVIDQTAHDAALAEITKDELMLGMQTQDLLFAQEQQEKETADVEAMQKVVADLLQLMLLEAPPEPQVEEVTTTSPLTFSIRTVGSGSFAMDVENLPADRSIAIQRLIYRWDSSRYVNELVMEGVGEESAFTTPDGTLWFSTLPEKTGRFADTMIEVSVWDASRKVYATRTFDLQDIIATPTPDVIVNEVMNTVKTTVTTESMFQTESLAFGAPTIGATIVNGTVRLQTSGMPMRTTAVIRGPNVEYRDLVMPQGSGDIAPDQLSPALLIEGKYTIELFRNGQSLGAAQALSPGKNLSADTLERSNALVNAAETLTAKPRMQMIATQEGLTFRYQYLEEGSTLEIVETDHGSLISNSHPSKTVLTGTQGTMMMKGKMPDNWYRFLVTGPGSSKTVLEWHMYIPGDVGLIVSNPIFSATTVTKTPLGKTSPMPWLVALDHQTINGTTYNWAADFAAKAKTITGLDLPADEIAGAFTTIVWERMGIPCSLLSPVAEPLREAINCKFSQLFDAYSSVSGTQSADVAACQQEEQLAWAIHDERVLAESTLPGAVSDDIYARQLNSIIEGHSADPDGGAEQLFRYAWSVQRNPTVAEVAGWTGRGVGVVEGVIEKLNNDIVTTGLASLETTGWEWVGETTSIEKPTSKNTMIIVIYGSNQFPGFPNSEGELAGFELLVKKLKENYEEVWALSPGLNLFEGPITFTAGPSPAEMQPEIEKFISARLQQRPNIKNIVLGGYSWGGGLVYDVASWLTKTHPQTSIAATIYVDAVNDDYSMGAENRLPPTTRAMLNIFQSIGDVTDFYLNGGKVDNNEKLRDFVEIDFDADLDNETHSTIDRAAENYILRFLLQRIVPRQL